MNCYYQGCTDEGVTKEHIPPRSFFPEGERVQLLTVKSCEAHNNAKSKNDLYVLAHICMNASPSNRAREVWNERVVPQLSFNNNALRKMLSKGSVNAGGGVRYVVDHARFDEFFTALSCGLIYKSQKVALPQIYKISHIYHSFSGDTDEMYLAIEANIDRFYADKPLKVLEFGNPDLQNERIYSVEIHGIPRFESSITIVHKFFGVFKVTSMLSRVFEPDSN